MTKDRELTLLSSRGESSKPADLLAAALRRHMKVNHVRVGKKTEAATFDSQPHVLVALTADDYVASVHRPPRRKVDRARLQPSSQTVLLAADLCRTRSGVVIVEFGALESPRRVLEAANTLRLTSAKRAPSLLKKFLEANFEVSIDIEEMVEIANCLDALPAASAGSEIRELVQGPNFTEFIVDGAISRELSQARLGDETLSRLKRGEFIDLKYHYVGWKMAQLWQDLINANSYGHEELRFFIERRLPEALIVAGLDSSDEPIDVFSLGPGDGNLDEVILKKLKEFVGVRRYSLVDISIELLLIAVNRVIDSGHLGLAADQTDIRAVMSDFEIDLDRIDEVEEIPPVRRLYLLNGFTFGNSSEQNLVGKIGSSMRPGDLLLFDVRLHKFGKLTPTDELKRHQEVMLKAPYESPELQRFAFGPVEEFTNYSVRLDDFGGDLEFSYRVAIKEDSQVASAVNVFLGCSGLYAHQAFRERVGLAPLANNAARRRREQERSLTLAKVTFYNLDDLKQWLSGERLEVLWDEVVEREGTDMALILCRLPE